MKWGRDYYVNEDQTTKSFGCGDRWSTSLLRGWRPAPILRAEVPGPASAPVEKPPTLQPRYFLKKVKISGKKGQNFGFRVSLFQFWRRNFSFRVLRFQFLLQNFSFCTKFQLLHKISVFKSKFWVPRKNFGFRVSTFQFLRLNFSFRVSKFQFLGQEFSF